MRAPFAIIDRFQEPTMGLSSDLTGKRIAILATDGFEQSERHCGLNCRVHFRWGAAYKDKEPVHWFFKDLSHPVDKTTGDKGLHWRWYWNKRAHPSDEQYGIEAQAYGCGSGDQTSTPCPFGHGFTAKAF
jgi:hypothetical protein